MLYWIFSTRLMLRTMFLTIPLPISFQARVDQNLHDTGKAEMKQTNTLGRSSWSNTVTIKQKGPSEP